VVSRIAVTKVSNFFYLAISEPPYGLLTLDLTIFEPP